MKTKIIVTFFMCLCYSILSCDYGIGVLEEESLDENSGSGVGFNLFNIKIGFAK